MTVYEAQKMVDENSFEEYGLYFKDGFHRASRYITTEEFRVMPEELLLILSNERNPNRYNRYTSIAKRAQKAYQERKGGMHSTSHWCRDHSAVGVI